MTTHDLEALAERTADLVVARLRGRDDRPLLSDREAAKRLGVSDRMVWKLVSQGRLRKVSVGSAARFEPAELDRFIAANGSSAKEREGQHG